MLMIPVVELEIYLSLSLSEAIRSVLPAYGCVSIIIIFLELVPNNP
jgi:hypothetical protein